MQRIMVILMPIERETLQVFLKNISQMLNMSTFGNTADIYAMFHLIRHACHGRRPYLLLLSPSGKSGQLCVRAFPLKNSESFSLYRCKNYHDLLRSLFVANF
jgi:hypothetical protein